MKKILLIAALAAACLTASAQNRGDMAVGGIIGINGGSTSTAVSLNGNTTTTKTPAGTMFGFSPQFSYFVIDNLELSAGLSYQMQRDPNGTTSDGTYLFSTTNIAMFDIGASYYIPLIDSKLYWTPGIYLGFGGGSVVSQNSTSSKTTTKIPFAFGLNAGLGTIEFKPVDFLGISLNLLDLTLVYTEINTGSSNVKVSTSAFEAGLNYGISAGVKYYF